MSFSPAIRKIVIEIATPAVILFASLLLVHHESIFSRFSVLESGPGDAMLINYTLEHDYRWFTANRLEPSLWSPPIFYPQHDTAAYTDLMLGTLPPYALWRLLGAGPFTAFQLWFITMSALNFLSAYGLLRYLLGCGWIASSAGALLLAFGSPRLAQWRHPQLLPGFYIVIAFAGVCLLFTRDPRELGRRRVYGGLALFLGAFLCQLYTTFCYAWFMTFASSLAVVFAFLLPGPRARLLGFLRLWWGPTLGAALLAALALAPYAAVASTVMKEVGGFPYSAVLAFLPSAKAWLAQGPNHLLYGRLNRLAGVGSDFGSQEMFNGIGLLTSTLVIYGLFVFRGRTIVRLWALVALGILLLSYQWPGGASLWHFVFDWYPGAVGVRAVSRFSLFLLLPASIALALAIDHVRARFSAAAALVCLLLVGLEQAGSLIRAPGFPKVRMRGQIESVAHQIRPECRTFLFSWIRGAGNPEIMHILGMWVELETGVPTLNGYSSHYPPHWTLQDVAVGNAAEQQHLFENIETWVHEHPHDFQNVCWVLPEMSPKPHAVMQLIDH